MNKQAEKKKHEFKWINHRSETIVVRTALLRKATENNTSYISIQRSIHNGAIER